VSLGSRQRDHRPALNQKHHGKNTKAKQSLGKRMAGWAQQRQPEMFVE
jgi:hypothetical protein